MRKIDVTGLRFGRLTVQSPSDVKRNGRASWICICDCGNIVNETSSALRSGNTQSCGCLNKDLHTKHGASDNKRRHPLYISWRNMKSRCYNKNHKYYSRYGGRGIRVCAEWRKSYVVFRDYMLSLPNCPENAQMPNTSLSRTIDRIRNNESYEPGNMKWSTAVQQNNNRESNRIVFVNGKPLTFIQAATKYGKAPADTIRARLIRGWSLRDAFRTEINHG